MALTGKQRAALLLLSLDTVTAAELIRGVDSKTVQELAVELAYLDAAGYRNSRASQELVVEFYSRLNSQQGFQIKRFLGEMLKNTVGEAKATEIQGQIESLLQERDPFITIREVKPKNLAAILSAEHPQAAAVVLSELETQKSSEVLSLLDENLRFAVIGRMTSSEVLTGETKAKIAKMICKRIESVSSVEEEAAGPAKPEKSLRKVAVILRNLSKELRDGLVSAIQEKDGETAGKVSDLMVIWEDITQIADRPLQEGLRNIDAQKLALALRDADEAINQKIRSNISERASAMIDEEASLMSAPNKEDIEGAREEIVKVLREMNADGKLSFAEE